MHDIRLIRENPAGFDAMLARRGLSSVSSEILALDAERRNCITRAEAALAERNQASKEIGLVKKTGNQAEFEALRERVAAMKDEVAALEAEAKAKDEALTALLMGLPNAPLDSVPDGADEDDNLELRRWGAPRAFD
ncbi:MAG: serine--tRNA ligase, partial [Pseudomonadota bacterium]